MVFITAFIGILGLFVGSFLLVLIGRIPRGEPFLLERSHCDFCRHMLSWYDLIPVVSYLSLQGRCRYCHHKLSTTYPIAELLTAVLFVIVFLSLFPMGFQFTFIQIINFLFYLFVICSLIIIFFVDLKHMMIPFVVLFPIFFLVFLYKSILQPGLLLNSFLSAFFSFLFFLILYIGTKSFLKKEGIGFGDVVYAFFMGFLLGYPQIVYGLYIAFVTGSLISIVLILLRKKRLRGDTIPFGPFLVFGTIVSFLYGDIVKYVFSTFLLLP